MGGQLSKALGTRRDSSLILPLSGLAFFPVCLLPSLRFIYPSSCTLVRSLNPWSLLAIALLGKIFGNKEMRILMLGLDAAGKTSQSNQSFVLPSSLSLIVSSPFISPDFIFTSGTLRYDSCSLSITNTWFSNQSLRRLLVIRCLPFAARSLPAILYKLKLNQSVTTIPTVGFNVETVTYKQVKFNVWDVGGQDKIRPLWRHYYTGTQVSQSRGRFKQGGAVRDWLKRDGD